MAYGLRPVKHLVGGTPLRLSQYPILSTYAADLFKGDPVIQHTDGTINLAVGTAGTPSTTLLGVFDGCFYTDTNGAPVYSKKWPSGQVATDAVAFVYDDPYTVFRIQADQVGTAIASTFVGQNIDMTAAVGDALNQISGWFLDSSGTTGAATQQVRILGSGEHDNSFTAVGTAMDVLVTINEHVYKSAVGVA